MQQPTKLYLVLSYILIPIALFFGFMVSIAFIIAFANPSVLLPAFAMACIVIYSYTSFKFLKLGLEKGEILSTQLKDWIKVNAYVSLLIFCMFFLNAVGILFSNDASLIHYLDNFIAQQPGLPPEFNSQLLLKAFRIVAYFLFMIGAVGMIHILMTLKLVRANDHLFE